MYNPIHKREKTDGLYMIAVRVLNKKDNILVYGYIYYPNILVNCLYLYFVSRCGYKTYNEWGYYLSMLFEYNELKNNKVIQDHNKKKYMMYLSILNLKD